MKVYLAGPINGQRDDECRAWRKHAKSLLESAGHLAVDPMDRDYRGLEDCFFREIVRSDKNDIDSCEALLVNAIKPSWGTAMEIAYGHSRGKVVVLFCGGAQISPWLRFHSTEIVEEVDEAVQRLAACR